MPKQQPLNPYFDLIIDDALARNEWPEKLDEYRKDKEHVSLMAKVMRKEVFDDLKQHKTKTAGWTIARAINSGTCYASSFVGCHAGDKESYTDFAQLFRPVIEAYHKGFNLDRDSHKSDLDVAKITSDFDESAKDKIVSTRIRVARNLNSFPLNPGGTKKTRLEILDLMEDVVRNLPDDLKGELLRHATMTPKQIQELVDEHLLFRGQDKMQAASGYHTDWPAGRGIFISKARNFVLWINEGDHLRIISMESGWDVKSVFERLSRGISAIEKAISKSTGNPEGFMSDPILGTITCCPSNLGTAMRGSVHMLVPKLITKLGLIGIEKIAQDFDCQARGSSGEHSQVVEKIDISNSRRLGLCEFELIDDMMKCVNTLATLEDELS